MATYHLVALALSADDDLYNHGAGRSIFSTGFVASLLVMTFGHYDRHCEPTEGGRGNPNYNQEIASSVLRPPRNDKEGHPVSNHTFNREVRTGGDGRSLLNNDSSLLSERTVR